MAVMDQGDCIKLLGKRLCPREIVAHQMEKEGIYWLKGCVGYLGAGEWILRRDGIKILVDKWNDEEKTEP